MWNIIAPLLVKLSFEFVINSKMDFSGSQKVKNLIFTLNLSFLVQLGTLIRDIPSLSYSPETTQSPTTTLPKNVFCIDTPRNFTQNSDKSAILAIFQ